MPDPQRKRRPPIRIPALALALLAAPAAGQTVADEQLWINATAQGSLSGDLVYLAEVQPRLGEGISAFDQIIFRPAIGWRLSSAVSVYQGYANVRTARGLRPDAVEDRSFQQLSLNFGRIGRGELTGRTRLEQRWRNDGDDTGWRVRQQLRYEHPLSDAEAPVAALGWVEGFWNLNGTDWGTASGFDRVRAFAGLELPLSGRSTAEIGYMNQTVDEFSGGTGIDHVVSISLMLRH